MANVETRRNEYRLAGAPRVYFIEIWVRGGSRRGAKGIRTVGQKAGKPEARARKKGPSIKVE